MLSGVSLLLEAINAVRAGEAAGLYRPGFIEAAVADRLAETNVGHESRCNYEARWTGHSGTAENFSPTDTDRVGPIDTTPAGTSNQDEVVGALRWQRAAVASRSGGSTPSTARLAARTCSSRARSPR
jgi:hypothetical protein